ncbi:MAG TPA: radical SAM protein [Bacteroidales bacterium]|nr:radical SAM protein [Bacteroidales bacterium]
MKFSRYNIFSKIHGSNNFFIVNLLSGNADILDPYEARIVDSISRGVVRSLNDFLSILVEKGYISDPDSEQKLFRQKYLEFLDNRYKDEIQIFFITNYSCNFSCNYCYQDQYNIATTALSKEVIDLFLKYINTSFSDRKKYITLFGGEPLLSSPIHKELIEYFVSETAKLSFELCVVTNGYTLPEYIDILSKGRIREIQVTLDGTASVHNSRRHLKGGWNTFEKVVNGIDLCLENNFPVNLRVVVDKENFENLHELAKFSINKGWTDNPLFKTQLGRNYELHHCQSDPGKLFDRASLYENLYLLIQKNPEFVKFHKPAYSFAKFLSQNGKLPDPLFDSCPACKTEWAFDFTGNIYPCTATVGKEGESLGKFFPSNETFEELINIWESRDILSIEKCADCNLSLACGGGCGSVAKNLNGTICSPDCRPIKELLELGFAAYFS